MKYSYSNYVEAFSDSYKKVEIDHEYVNRIAAFVKELITAKSIEKHHQRDNLNEIKRFTTGYLFQSLLGRLKTRSRPHKKRMKILSLIMTLSSILLLLYHIIK